MPGDVVAQRAARAKWQARVYAERRARCHEYLGGKCAQCGATEDLQIDHVDPSTKEFALMSRWKIPWEQAVEELNKCQLLCRTHHREKTTRERSVPHGGGLTGKKNCRCDLCAPLKDEYLRRWRQGILHNEM